MTKEMARYQEWLMSLLPIEMAAIQFTGGDESACIQKALEYESLIVVGITGANFVDVNLFEHFMFYDLSNAAKSEKLTTKYLRSAKPLALELHKSICDLKSEYFGVCSTIAKHNRDMLLEPKRVEREHLSKAILQLGAKQESLRKQLQPLQVKMNDLVEGYKLDLPPTEPEKAKAEIDLAAVRQMQPRPSKRKPTSTKKTNGSKKKGTSTRKSA